MLLSDERQVINYVRADNKSISLSTLIVVMVTREHSRPREELLDILSQYENLQDSNELKKIFEKLIYDGYIMQYEKDNIYFYKASAKLINYVENIIKNNNSNISIENIKKLVWSEVKVLGRMESNEIIYQTYIDLISGAQSEILLPMLATSPSLSSAELLQKKALNGVSIKILLGSKSVVGMFRGKTNEKKATESILGWSNKINCPKFEVRITESPIEAELSTCMLIDGKILRYDIYDPYNQRSLQGIMLEVENPPGNDLNIIRQFKRNFSISWANARKANESKFKYIIRTKWEIILELIAGPILLYISFKLDGKQVEQKLCIGLAGAFIYNLINISRIKIYVAYISSKIKINLHKKKSM